jgi:hypothetical protein
MGFKAVKLPSVRRLAEGDVAFTIAPSAPARIKFRISGATLKTLAQGADDRCSPYVDFQTYQILLVFGGRDALECAKKWHTKTKKSIYIEFPRMDEFEKLFPEAPDKGPLKVVEVGPKRLVIQVPKPE